MLERSRNGAKVRRPVAGSTGKLRARAKPAASANLVAVESLKQGDEILTPWGRDHVDTISDVYNVMITERKRQIPIRRNGRPVLVKRADPAAASRRKPVAQANVRLLGLLTVARLAPILRKVGMSEVRAQQLAGVLEKARTADEAYEKLQKSLGTRADYIAKAIGLPDPATQGPKVPAGYKQTTVDQLVPGDEIIIYPHGKDVVEKVSSGRKAVKTRDGQIIAGKATVYVKASRRTARAAGREDFVPSRLQVTFSSRGNAQNAVADLRDIGVRSIISSRALDERKSKGVTTVLVSMPLDPKQAKQIYRILDDWDGQASTRYTASRRTAHCALPALLAVARVAPILVRFGLTAKNATALANALAKTTTAYEAYQKLRDDLGSGAEGIAKALGLNPEETKVAYQKATAPVAGRRAVRAAMPRQRYKDQVIRFPSEQRARLALRTLNASEGGAVDATTSRQDLILEGCPADLAQELADELHGTYVGPVKPGARFSRRSARAGWRGAKEADKPAREKFGSLARMLMQHNVSDPRKLPDDAKKSFNALLAATVEKTELPQEDIIGQAMKQAKSYAEQLSTGASRRSVRADSDSPDAGEMREQLWGLLIDNKVKSPRNLPTSEQREFYQIAGELARLLGKGRAQVISQAVHDVSTGGMGPSRDVRASTIDDMEMAVKLLVDYQVSKPHMLPPDAEREFWSLMAKVSSARRTAPGNEATNAFMKAKHQRLRASRATKLARVACRRAARLSQRKPAAAAAYRGFKDTAKVAQLHTYKVSLKVDARVGTYEGSKELAQHIDDALQAAGLNAYDVYVR